jgi:hypothetical protein
MIQITTEMTGFAVFGIAKRRWKEWMRQAFAETALFWFENLLPLHFKINSKERYNHKPRSAKYLRAKRRAAARGKVKYGGNVDNVYTGAMEELLRSACAIRAYPTRAVVRMAGPRYMTMTPFTGDRSKGFKYGKNRSQTISRTAGQQPDKVAELTTVTTDELQVMSNIFANSLTRQFNELRDTQTIKISAA